jgi:hypothetical protein
MAAADGIYFLTWEKNNTNNTAYSMEAETHNVMLVGDATTPAFDTDEFRSPDVDDEVAGSGYSSGGQNFTGTEWSVAAGIAKYDCTDPQWTTIDLSADPAMAAVYYYDSGAAATDQLLFMQDFVTQAAPDGGNLDIAVDTLGLWQADLIP